MRDRPEIGDREAPGYDQGLLGVRQQKRAGGRRERGGGAGRASCRGADQLRGGWAERAMRARPGVFGPTPPICGRGPKTRHAFPGAVVFGAYAPANYLSTRAPSGPRPTATTEGFVRGVNPTIGFRGFVVTVWRWAGDMWLWRHVIGRPGRPNDSRGKGGQWYARAGRAPPAKPRWRARPASGHGSADSSAPRPATPRMAERSTLAKRRSTRLRSETTMRRRPDARGSFRAPGGGIPSLLFLYGSCFVYDRRQVRGIPNYTLGIALTGELAEDGTSEVPAGYWLAGPVSSGHA